MKKYRIVTIIVIIAIIGWSSYYLLKPYCAKICYKKGTYFVKIGSYEKALKWYEIATKLNSDYIDAWTGRGYALKKLGRYEDLVKVFDNIIKIDSGGNFLAWRQKGITLEKLNQYEGALESYEKSIELSPNNAQVWYLKGEVLKKLSRQKESESAFKKAKELGYK